MKLIKNNFEIVTHLLAMQLAGAVCGRSLAKVRDFG